MRIRLLLATLMLAVVLAGGCGGTDSDSTANGDETTEMDVTTDATPFAITAEDFGRGGSIPVRLTCDGADDSPRLFWTAVPDGAEELALVMDDPDAGGFVHWVAYNTPATAREFAANETEADGTVTFGANDFGGTGWAGPCPPAGDPHKYDFTLFALSEPLELEPGATAEELRSAMDGKILDQACISAFYTRRDG